MVAMRFPWKRCGWYLAFVGSASPTLPQSVESCRRNQPTIFQVWGHHSWRESANEGPFHAATSSKLEPCCLMGAVHAAQGDPARSDREIHSLLETAWLATYSSLRRKKSLALSGDIPFHARGVREQARRAEPSIFEWLLETRFNRACVFACVLTWLLFKSNTTSQKREEKAEVREVGGVDWRRVYEELASLQESLDAPLARESREQGPRACA